MTVDSSAKVDNLNADTVDGIDSSGFIQGKGGAYRAFVNSSCVFFCPVLSVPGFGELSVAVPDTTSGQLEFLNQSGGSLSMTWFNQDGVGYTNAIYADITPQSASDYFVLLQAGRNDRMATITASMHFVSSSPNYCEVKAQALVQVG